SMPLHLLEFIDGFALSTPKSGDCMILPRQCPGQFVDLGLVFRSQGSELGSIAFEERLRIGYSTPAIMCPARQQTGDQRGHTPRDLPLDHVDLPLCLTTRRFHPGEMTVRVWRKGHAEHLP